MNIYHQRELTDKEYEDILNELYEDIIICGMPYAPGYALHEVDPIAFRCGKMDYEASNSVYVCSVCNTEYADEDEAENCCKLNHLIELLETLSFIGTDASLEESLTEYSIVYREPDGYTILYSNVNYSDDTADMMFCTLFITRSDVLESLQDIKEGFYSFIGTDRKEYIEGFSTVHAIQALKQYGCNGLVSDQPYTLTIDDLIKSLESEAVEGD